MKRDLSPRGRMLMSMLIFGTVGLFVRYIPLPSSAIACARGVIGAVCIYLYMKMYGRKIDLAAVKSNALTLLFSGAALGFNWAFLFEAYRYSVSTATLMYYLAPTIVMLVSPFALKEKLTARRLICCLISLGGMVLVSGVLTDHAPQLPGVLWGLAAAALYAAVMILNRRITG
ncbi:MAG: DMT family transporter, partial [Clostridia bacterium]|nr:DMT family transporter [Clostridia bacterium]